MAKKKTEDPTGSDQPSPASEVEVCKLCGEEIEKRHLSCHLWTIHAMMTLVEYEGWYLGKPRVQAVELGTIERVPPPPPPPPPEPELPVMEVRLADVPSNPRFESVQGRTPGPTYGLSKGEWTPVAAPDYWIIVGSGDIPSKYPYLTFETRKPKKQRGKK